MLRRFLERGIAFFARAGRVGQIWRALNFLGITTGRQASTTLVQGLNGPAARIGETVTINLPKPLDRLSLVDQSAYGVAKRQMLDFLYRKHAQTVS